MNYFDVILSKLPVPVVTATVTIAVVELADWHVISIFDTAFPAFDSNFKSETAPMPFNS